MNGHDSNTPPCGVEPDRWDLDVGNLVDWLGAIEVCTQQCPLARYCRGLTLDQMQRGTPPLGLIQSGVAFTATGRPMDPLQLVGYAGRANRHTQPGRAA